MDEFVKVVEVVGGMIVKCDFMNDKVFDFFVILINLKGMNLDVIFYGGGDV